MTWVVEFHPVFYTEYEAFSQAVQDALLEAAALLRALGPTLGGPYADTLSGSKFRNMKELRFDADGGVWRGGVAFDLEGGDHLCGGAGRKGGGPKRCFSMAKNRTAAP